MNSAMKKRIALITACLLLLALPAGCARVDVSQPAAEASEPAAAATAEPTPTPEPTPEPYTIFSFPYGASADDSSSVTVKATYLSDDPDAEGSEKLKSYMEMVDPNRSGRVLQISFVCTGDAIVKGTRTANYFRYMQLLSPDGTAYDRVFQMIAAGEADSYTEFTLLFVIAGADDWRALTLSDSTTPEINMPLSDYAG